MLSLHSHSELVDVQVSIVVTLVYHFVKCNKDRKFIEYLVFNLFCEKCRIVNWTHYTCQCLYFEVQAPKFNKRLNKTSAVPNHIARRVGVYTTPYVTENISFKKLISFIKLGYAFIYQLVRLKLSWLAPCNSELLYTDSKELLVNFCVFNLLDYVVNYTWFELHDFSLSCSFRNVVLGNKSVF